MLLSLDRWYVTLNLKFVWHNIKTKTDQFWSWSRSFEGSKSQTNTISKQRYLLNERRALASYFIDWMINQIKRLEHCSFDSRLPKFHGIGPGLSKQCSTFTTSLRIKYRHWNCGIWFAISSLIVSIVQNWNKTPFQMHLFSCMLLLCLTLVDLLVAGVAKSKKC